MRDWYVELETTHLLADRQALRERLDHVVETLREYVAVVHCTDNHVRVRMRIPAMSADRAVEKARNLFSLSLIAVRIPYTPGPTLVGAEPVEETSHVWG